MNKKEYNGWYNYETWCVNLCLTNEESTDSYWRTSARLCFREATIKRQSFNTVSEEARYCLSKLLESEVNESMPDLGASMFTYLLNAAMSEVNWVDIADHFLEEVEYGDDKYESKED